MKTTRVFISGSRSIKKLSYPIIELLDTIMRKQEHVLIGDAKGVDELIQGYFYSVGYNNVTVYTVHDQPRICKSDKFYIKPIYVPKDFKGNRFQKEQLKDKEMTQDCDYLICIWDELSPGTRDNIIRGKEYNKPVIIYSTIKNNFIR